MSVAPRLSDPSGQAMTELEIEKHFLFIDALVCKGAADDVVLNELMQEFDFDRITARYVLQSWTNFRRGKILQ
jgi:hypothetical protein